MDSERRFSSTATNIKENIEKESSMVKVNIHGQIHQCSKETSVKE